MDLSAKLEINNKLCCLHRPLLRWRRIIFIWESRIYELWWWELFVVLDNFILLSPIRFCVEAILSHEIDTIRYRCSHSRLIPRAEEFYPLHRLPLSASLKRFLNILFNPYWKNYCNVFQILREGLQNNPPSPSPFSSVNRIAMGRATIKKHVSCIKKREL